MFLFRFRNFLLWPALLLAGRLLAAPPPETVTLVLKNGDRVTGTVTHDKTNEVWLTTPWAKEISIPTSMIEKREKVPTGPDGKPLLPSTAALKPKPQKWHFETQAGVNTEINQQTSQLYYGALKASYTGLRFRDFAEYKANYGKVDNLVSANNMNGSLRTEYDITQNKRAFVFNAAGAGYDEIRKIDFTYDESVGVGYKFINRTNLMLSGDTGLNYQDQFFTDHIEQNYIALRLGQAFMWKINPRVTWDEKAEFYPRLTRVGDYRARLESNLSYKLNPAGSLFLTLTFIDAYDTRPASGVTANDLQIRSALGVKF